MSNFKNLIKEFNHLSLNQVTALVSWFIGDLNEPLKTRLPTNMQMKSLDLNVTGNDGRLACFKQECRTVPCLVWPTIKNNSR
jgi:hypothetical protein